MKRVRCEAADENEPDAEGPMTGDEFGDELFEDDAGISSGINRTKASLN